MAGSGPVMGARTREWVEAYQVIRQTDWIDRLVCSWCPWSVNVRALHRTGDKSGAGRYCRARMRMVAHLHASHREMVAGKVAVGA